ncbi:xanthine dehydrogenase [Trichophyton rubrum D6]|uniref:xanthine dehydrogenase n=3 Tax=Trichophyton rubrum TaxID=5551 RepID=A0A178F6Q7_TRIRU|nr:xanthine dehydrogenase [Trichophyton rubrum MR850]EZF45376.1 xanthine dehydrogenase [Trichophyton rubrum CBS 100081]EZF55925.1 xanthine dehydrogenase [Trichophyton rubrum CBS 288.86]EZF66624.1 xanthine dehydrogenase [Trichophyton rubrum CBS 289.86]EZF87922.1 xanthine dehydrogenase [Trichophyton rubrum MR1448]EZG20217.1 xanthine dehydrogenase [Trichophyton rubrum CBS 202.88]KDB37102.1 xanthine dehydrogenase [Trichophyton rubrum D6]KMQ47018.1 2Fe-2S ferredoxin, iron-sulfur binding site [Tri
MAPAIVEEPQPPASKASLAAVTEKYDDTLRFYLNGTKVTLDSVDPEATLLEYLRGIGLTGTKLGCAEGGCGACTVVVSYRNPTTKKIYHASVNACLAPLVSVDGKHVITVEGIGTSKNPHPVQQRIAVGNGSQCGFCTPGIVMSLYALLRNDPTPSELAIEEAFDGNLCRCTGYRSILDSAQSFSTPSCAKARANGGSGCCKENGGSCNGGAKNGDSDGITPKAITQSFNTPEFIPYNPETELIFPPQLHRHELKPLSFGNKRKRWYRPVTMHQLLEIKDAYPEAKVIGGSSETQIEIKFKARQYTHSVYVGDIPELKQYTFTDDYLDLGANVSLTDLEEICDEALQRYGPTKAQPFIAIKKQIRYFAGRQIRNVASPAGNIATASPISDLNPVFVATGTILFAKSLKEEVQIPMDQFFKGYRTTALPANAVVAKLRIPISQENGEYLRAYKQAKRKDDDIAIVNAALRVSLSDSNVVMSANLVYGGMAPTTIPAKKAEEFIVGKIWTDPATVEGVMDALGQDFDLPSSVPGGMPTYRKTLAFGFFYRFYHDVLSSIQGVKVHCEENAVSEIERGLSSGVKDHEATAAYTQKIVGKATPTVSALLQTTGEAQYTDDIPVQKNELFGCLVLSTKARAKILSIDFTPALDIPGVVNYVSAKDLLNPESNWWGAPVSDEIYFAVNEVVTDGQPLGMIVATSARLAEAGSRAVKVEYEVLPAILTIEQAIEHNSFFNHITPAIKKGDVEAAFASSDHVYSGTTRIGGQEHFYLETHACVVVPKPEYDEIEVFSSTQNPAEVQAFVAKVTGVAENKVVCRVKRLGGGFGGKGSRSVQIASICALAAKKTKKPVRCMLNRDEDIATTGQRHPFLCHWKVGVNKDGKLQALDADIYANGGHSQDLSLGVVQRALSHIDGVYKIPNVHVRGYLCRTNTVSNTAFRGFGGPQGMFFAESFVSEIADHLKIPVEKLREINMYKDHEETHFNQELTDWHVPLMYKQVLEESNYFARQKAVEEYNRTHKWSKRGIAIIPTKFGLSFTALFLNQAGALVHIYRDGSILLAHGGTEMGQGLHTKMVMIAAEALKVPQSSVFISETATNTVANTSPTAASASSDLNGYAIFNACEQLNQRLRPYREANPNATMKELATAAYFDRVNLSAQGFYKTPEIGYKWGENTGKMFYYFTQGVTAAEVEIDTLTGDWTPLRADIKMDVGQSINPSIDYGQIEGAFIQGQGLFTTEESLWHRASGQIFTRGPGTYKIPGFRDIPQVFNVSLLKDVEWKDLRTIQRSRGVGEPPLFMGSAVFFAIRDALKAARKEWNSEEVLRLDSPATPERIRISCCDPLVEKGRVEDRGDGFFVSI